MTRAADQAPSSSTPPGVSAGELRNSVAANLRRARTELGWSLRELATRSDVSKALLSKIERGEGNPSIETLYRISAALGCGMSELIAVEVSQLEVVRANEGRTITSDTVDVSSRLIFATGQQGRVEIYECMMGRNARSEWNGRAKFGVTEFAVIQEGRARVGPAGKEKLLGPGDAIAFRHSARNAYQSLDQPVKLVCIITYDD